MYKKSKCVYTFYNGVPNVDCRLLYLVLFGKQKITALMPSYLTKIELINKASETLLTFPGCTFSNLKQAKISRVKFFTIRELNMTNWDGDSKL